jgi:hypothetical protein
MAGTQASSSCKQAPSFDSAMILRLYRQPHNSLKEVTSRKVNVSAFTKHQPQISS